MDFSEVRDVLEQECHFPADHATILELVGGVELEGVAPEQETVQTVLERTEEATTTYRSPVQVYETLLGSVGDGYVGRKYYDDRGGTRSIPEDRSIQSV